MQGETGRQQKENKNQKSQVDHPEYVRIGLPGRGCRFGRHVDL
jgi:hypothetical protein